MALTKRYNEFGTPVYGWEDDEEAPSRSKAPSLPRASSQSAAAAPALRSEAPSQSPSFVRQQSSQDWMARQAGLPRPLAGDTAAEVSAPLSPDARQAGLPRPSAGDAAAAASAPLSGARVSGGFSHQPAGKAEAALRNVAYGFSALGPAVVSTGNAILQGAADTLGLRGVLPAVDDTLDAIQGYNDSLQRGRELETREIQRVNQESGLGSGLGTGLLQAAGGMIPNAVVAAMSGGGSTAAQLGQQGGSALAQIGGQLVKNPSAWLSAAQTLGPSYEEALASGADPARALDAAALDALLSSAIEVQGGLEGIPQGAGLLRSMAEEGLEEVKQGVIHGAAQNALAGAGNPIFSTEDQSAVLNPLRAGEEFILGAAAAGLMGAPMRLWNAARGGDSGRTPAIQPYTEQEAANLSSPKGVVNGRDGTFRQFIQEARSGKDSKKFYFGKLSGDVVDAIKKETLRNVEGYNLVINSDEVRHIFRQHGGEGELSRGQIPVTEDLMELIPYVFDSPDRVTASPKPDYAGRTAFQVEKDLGEGYAIVMNGISDGKQSVAVDSFYIKKRPPTTSDALSPPNQRPKPSSGPASGSIVAESDAGVNRTHRVVNNIDLVQTEGGETGPEPAAPSAEPSLYNTLISDSPAGVNGSMPSQGSGTQALSAGSGSAAVTQAPDTSTQKSRRYQGRVVRRLADEVADALSLPAGARRDFIDGVNQQVVEEVRRTGRVSDATREQLFREAYARGAVVLEDYYNQYRDLKNTLRTTPLTLSLTDRADVGDYSGFRRDSFGTLRLTDQGGLPVDSFYQELSGEYPQLFPADLTHPGDQAKRLLEVGKGIARVELDLDSYHGADAEEFRLIARHNFDEALNRFEEEMKPVFRYEADRALASSPGEGEAGPLLGVEEVDQLRQRLQAARRNSERVAAGELLTEGDKRVVDQLLAGIRDPGQIPQGMNVRGIQKVYEARKAVAEIQDVLAANKKAARAGYARQAEEVTAGQSAWKDKANGLLYNRETAERNIRDIVPDRAEAERVIAAYFTPVHQNQAALTRRANEIKGEIAALGLGTKKRYTLELPLEDGPARAKVSEAELVQLRGENLISDAQVEAAGADAGKINRAVEAFRRIYEQLFREVNEVLVRNGYDPIEYRQNYFPHFSPDTGSNSFLGRVQFLLGIRGDDSALPTDIAGLTYTFRPGKKWVGNFLRRQGEQTSYNALEGMDRYLSGVLDVIYHTGDIQRLRALENSIRFQNSEEGVRQEIRRIQETPTLSEDAMADAVQALYERNPSHLSNFVTWLRQYTDNLAGKKAIGDRTMEYNLGRRMYGIMNAVERRVAANMVGGNVSSALTNFIPIFQSMGEVNPIYTAQALGDAARAARSDDGFVKGSDFLTNRFGSEDLYRTGLQKATDAASIPFSFVDRISAEVVVRSKYLQNVAQGMSPSEAMADADAFAAGIMADRSKGAVPVTFNSQNPLAKAFSMFQVEVNNQLSYYFKDLPRNVGERGKAAVAGALFRTFLATWLYGTLFEKLAGYDPTLNPIGMGLDFYQDAREEGVKQAALNLGEEAAGQVPFVGGLLGGGRLPVADMFPDMGRIIGSAGEENFQEVLGDELLSSALQLLPPLGGNQLRKTIQGLETVREGGYYTTNKEGEEQLRFPVEQTPENYLRGAVFGRWSFPEARDYIDSGFKPLSAEYTARMKQGEANGITPQQFLAAYDAQRNATWTKGEYLAKAKAQKAAIDQALPNGTTAQKEFLYQAFGVSDKVW